MLLAVSGGRDSVTLCHLMAQGGFGFAIAHCNFHLRPGDCDRDEAFVRSLAEHYGVPCHVAQFDTLQYASREKLSVEDAARRLRYAFFDEVRDRERFDLVATAHHRDDSVETFFINLLRGTGITGLHGILPRNGHIIRPLLPFSRDEINTYVRVNSLEYVEDYTNSQPVYLRNRIRQQLIPIMRQLSPSFDDVMRENMRHLADAGVLYNRQVDMLRESLLRPFRTGYAISVDRLLQSQPVRTTLFELLRPFGFTSAVTDQIVLSLQSQSGKQFFSPTHRLIKDRSRLLLSPLTVDETPQFVVPSDIAKSLLPSGISVTMDKFCGIVPRLNHNEAWFDYDSLDFPLHMRHWSKGDRFRPFGMSGSRLVSDLFSDSKLSLADKESAWILCDNGGTILWIAGMRASCEALVTQSTKTVLKFTCRK